MKKCVYCATDLEDLARKCPACQSFQNPSDEPRRPVDIATLVISFVGSVAGIATVAATIFGYFGFKSLADMNARVDRAIKDANADMSKSKEEVNQLSDKLSKSEQQFSQSQSKLNGLLIRDAYANLDRILSSTTLDEMYAAPGVVDELKQLSETISAIAPTTEDAVAKSYKAEIQSIVEALLAYNARHYEQIPEILSALADQSLRKHMLLGTASARLYGIALARKDFQVASAWLDQSVRELKRALIIAENTRKQVEDAKINLAVVLIFRNGSGDLTAAYDYLMEAKKTSPKLAPIEYDLAGLFVKLHKLGDAMDALERAKLDGEFSSKDDVESFQADPIFEELRSKPEYKDRLARLLTFPN